MGSGRATKSRDYPPPMPEVGYQVDFPLTRHVYSCGLWSRQKPGALNRGSGSLPTLLTLPSSARPAPCSLVGGLMKKRWWQTPQRTLCGGEGSSEAGQSGFRGSWRPREPVWLFPATLPKPGFPLPFVPLAAHDPLWPDPHLLGQQVAQVSLHHLDPLSPLPMLLPLVSPCLSLPSLLQLPGSRGALPGDR